MNDKKDKAKNNFLESILRDFLHRSKKEEQPQQNIDKIYEGYKKLLDNQLKKSTERKDEIEEFYEILDNVYKMFSDPKTRKLIIASNLQKNDLIEKYAYRILGEDQKQDDATELFNEDLIGLVNIGNKTKRDIQYKPNTSETVKHKFRDANGRCITIRKIGELCYKTSFGVEKNTNKYIINRQNADLTETSEEFFSNILIAYMQDLNYKNAILLGLLGEENISRAGSSKYIGTVERRRDGAKKAEKESDEGVHTYNINDIYCIEYDAEDMTAVMLYENERKKDVESRNEEER